MADNLPVNVNGARRAGGQAFDRVCVVMLSTLGGAVWTLPVLTALKRARPGSRISWVMQPAVASLVGEHPALDEVILLDRARGVRGFVDLRRRLAGRDFDVVLAMQSYLKAGVATAMVRAPLKIGQSRRNARDANRLFTTASLPATPPQHIQDDYMDFARAVGVNPEPPEWNLGPWPSERESQQRFHADFSRPVAAVVVASTEDDRDWAPERIAELCDALWFDFNLEPVLVGGTSDRELRAKAVIDAHARRAPRSALGSGIRPLVGILGGAALVVSPDTGPLHMAAALGRPVISLMGHTNPLRKGPYRRFSDLVVDAFGDPGERYDAFAPNRPGRMQRITVRDVLDRVEIWRDRYARSTAPNL